MSEQPSSTTDPSCSPGKKIRLKDYHTDYSGDFPDKAAANSLLLEDVSGPTAAQGFAVG